MAEKARKWGSAVRYACLLALAVVLVITFHQNIQVTMVNGHSMEPTYVTGDLLVSIKHASYHVGDVIVYKPSTIDCALCHVVHRIIRRDGHNGWITQGDNNATFDGWQVTPREISGKVIWSVHLPPVLHMLYYPGFWLTVGLFMLTIWLLFYVLQDGEEEDAADETLTSSTAKAPQGPISQLLRKPRHRLQEHRPPWFSAAKKRRHRGEPKTNATVRAVITKRVP
jgi:signal peptidase